MTMTNNLIIAGSRHFNDYGLLKKVCAPIVEKYRPQHILSGCCEGADTLGEQFAKEVFIDVQKYPADWDQYGRKAGPIRNAEMVKNASRAVIFWDMQTRGSKNLYQQAIENGLQVVLVIF